MAMLASCASVEPLRTTTFPPVADKPFSIEGRLSARKGTEAVSANFTWRHDPPRDELVVTTPLGQQVAELSGDTQQKRVEMRTADGRVGESPDWSTITERALGYRLPVESLAAWIRGAPQAGTPSTVEPDAAGRASVLRQQGWEIVYTYPDETARVPSRVRASYPDLEVRIVVDRWG